MIITWRRSLEQILIDVGCFGSGRCLSLRLPGLCRSQRFASRKAGRVCPDVVALRSGCWGRRYRSRNSGRRIARGIGGCRRRGGFRQIAERVPEVVRTGCSCIWCRLRAALRKVAEFIALPWCIDRPGFVVEQNIRCDAGVFRKQDKPFFFIR